MYSSSKPMKFNVPIIRQNDGKHKENGRNDSSDNFSQNLFKLELYYVGQNKICNRKPFSGPAYNTKNFYDHCISKTFFSSEKNSTFLTNSIFFRRLLAKGRLEKIAKTAINTPGYILVLWCSSFDRDESNKTFSKEKRKLFHRCKILI